MYRVVILSFVAVAASAGDVDLEISRSLDLCAVTGNRLTLYYMEPKHIGELDIRKNTCLTPQEIKGTLRCCKKDPGSKFMMVDDTQECFKLSRDPRSCARDICLAKKKGFLTADDKLDTAKLEETLTKDYEAQSEFVEAVKTNCINGDLKKFGPPDMCDLMKMRHCIMLQALKLCPDWNDEGDCKGTKELVEECKKIIS